MQRTWTPTHTLMVVVFGLGWAMDAFEVTLIGNVLGALQTSFGIGANAMSLLLAAWFAGLMLGAVGFGALADRLGRRRVFLSSLLLYGIATLAAAVAPNFAVLMLLRLLAGIGVGAEYSAINAAVAELAPDASRGRAAALVLTFWPIGSLVASLLAWLVLSTVSPELGWRLVFAVGGLIALSTVWFRRHLPESARWQAAPRAPLSRLWRTCRSRLLLGMVLDFAEASGYYGLFAFLPLVVLPALRLTPVQLPVFYLAGGAGALVGGLAAALLLDRAGRFTTVTGFYVATAIATVLLALVSGWGAAALLPGFALVNLLATASWIAAYPTFSELFPTSLRASGIGASVAVGRIGAAASPFVVGWVGARSMPASLALLAVFWLLGAAAMLVWRRTGGVEARGRALEELANA
jgi:MFS family permease